MNKSSDHRKSGFTIIELLIVLTVVGILFTISSRVFYNIEASKIEATKAEIGTLRNSFNSFIPDYGNISIGYPYNSYDDIMDEFADILSRDYLDYEIIYHRENTTVYPKTVAVLTTKQQRDQWKEPYIIFVNTSDFGTAAGTSPAGKIYIVSGGPSKTLKNENDWQTVYNNCHEETFDEKSGIFTLKDGSIAATILPR